MKKVSFATLFIVTQIFFVVLIIYKQSKKIEFSYEKQKYEKMTMELLQKKKELTEELYRLKSYSSAKKYARSKNMKRVRLDQIKTISVPEK